MIQVGQKIDTSIRFQVVENGVERETSLQELLTKPMVISVYMKNNTGSCDKQNQSLAEHAQQIMDKGYLLMAVSKDTCGSHQKYAQKFGISYLLASDPDTLISKVTDSIVEKSMYGKTYEGPSRSAFVIDTNGTVIGLIEKVDSKVHGEQVLALLDTL